MRFFIPLIIYIVSAVLLAIRHTNELKLGNPPTSSMQRIREASKRGDITTATLDCMDFIGEEQSRHHADYWRCVYTYEVDGKEYRYKVETVLPPEDEVEVVFDRSNGCKRIDPDEKDLKDKITMFMPVIYAVAAFLVLSILGI